MEVIKPDYQANKTIDAASWQVLDQWEFYVHEMNVKYEERGVLFAGAPSSSSPQSLPSPPRAATQATKFNTLQFSEF